MLQSLSESGERSRATWAGEAGGDTTVAASAWVSKGEGQGVPHASEWQHMVLRDQKQGEREGQRRPYG